MQWDNEPLPSVSCPHSTIAGLVVVEGGDGDSVGRCVVVTGLWSSMTQVSAELTCHTKRRSGSFAQSNRYITSSHSENSTFKPNTSCSDSNRMTHTVSGEKSIFIPEKKVQQFLLKILWVG